MNEHLRQGGWLQGANVCKHKLPHAIYCFTLICSFRVPVRQNATLEYLKAHNISIWTDDLTQRNQRLFKNVKIA
jgi:hypothetical protein